MKRLPVAALVLFTFIANGSDLSPVQLQVTEVPPARFEKRGDVIFGDFGKDVYGNLRIEFSSPPSAGTVTVRLGEKLARNDAIDRNPPGTVNYREILLTVTPGRRQYQLEIPSKKRHRSSKAVKMPAYIGEVTPFRYAEIEGVGLALDAVRLHQLFVHAPFNDEASEFESSDETLNAVWAVCKDTMKATTAFGIYIDGERERTPYEADAYINMLSHYACDLDPRVARRSFVYLLAHPTWPTEWSLHMPMFAAADYMATGDLTLAADHYDALKRKLLQDKARSDGLLRTAAVVDWPTNERDGYNDDKPSLDGKPQAGPEINTVANAFYYRALREMAMLARALKKDDGARDYEAAAAQVFESFNRVFFNPARGLYIDGEGSPHASLHANMFPLAFGLVPPERQKNVADFVEARGMRCSPYGAQYLLEALFTAGRGDAAIRLMTAHTKRSWWHMIDAGSTLTWEAWDVKFKSNLDWNHAWGAAPANIISRYLLGVRPLQPGYSETLIAPQLGKLNWVRGKIPTPLGPVIMNATNGEVFKMEVSIPSGCKARLAVPRRPHGGVILDGKPVAAATTNNGRTFTFSLAEPGTHLIESRSNFERH